MSIKLKQVGRIANTVIGDFLANGSVPSIAAVLAGVYVNLGGRAAGTPQTNTIPVVSNTVTNPDLMTRNASQVAQDMQTLYDENIDLVNRIVRDFDYKQTKRERVAGRITSLNSDLIDAENQLQNSYSFSSSFSSFTTTDLTNTTAEIDFRSCEMTLPPASNRSTKADLIGANVTYSTNGTAASVVGSASDILLDSINDAFFIRVSSTNTSANLIIKITPVSPIIASKIEINAHVGSTTSAQVTINSQVLATQTINVSRHVSWQFAAQSLTSIVITMSKNIADAAAGNINYYDFGIKNVSIYSEEYAPAASFMTQPISFIDKATGMAAPIGTLNLIVDQTIPANCGVDWQIGFAGSAGSFSSITPGSPVVINTITNLAAKRTFPARTPLDFVNSYSVVNDQTGILADPGLSVTAGVRGNRARLFTLGSVLPNYYDLTVWRGRNAWKVTSYHYTTTSSGLLQNASPTLNDFFQPRGNNPVLYTRYQPTEYDLANQFPSLSSTLTQALRLPKIENPFNSSTDQVMHLYQACLIVNNQLAPSVLANLSATTVSLSNIFASTGSTGTRAVLYCNGVNISVTATTDSNNNLTYQAVLPLVPGKNTIAIVSNNVYSLGGGPFEFGTTLFTTLAAYGGQIMWYADAGPMAQVDLFELQYQTARNDFSRFSLATDPVSGNTVIVIHELPTTVYDITMTGLSSQLPTQVILQANLSGSPSINSLTPSIGSYQLVMSYDS